MGPKNVLDFDLGGEYTGVYIGKNSRVLHLTEQKLGLNEKEKEKTRKRLGTRGESQHREALHHLPTGDFRGLGWQFPHPAARKVTNSARLATASSF